MLSSSILALSLIPLTAYSAALPVQPQPESRSVASRSPKSIPFANNSFALTGTVPRRSAKQRQFNKYRQALIASRSSQHNTTDDVTSLNSPEGGVEYVTTVNIGGQDFTMIVDTGSSDLWVYASNFSCTDLEGNPVSQSTCNFGPASYDSSLSPTFEELNITANFNISYGDGEYLSGTPALDTVTVANLTVPSTEFSVVYDAAWTGDGISSGLLGLASPYLTSTYNGTDGSVDGSRNELVYEPFFYNAVDMGLVEPYFTLTLNRPSLSDEAMGTNLTNLGALAFGGLVPNISVTNTTVTVPNEALSLRLDGAIVSEQAYYTITVDEYTFPGSESLRTSTMNNLTIIDSGTTLIYARDDIAEAFAHAFSPPGSYNSDYGSYVVNCNAVVPDFNVTIGGTVFTTESQDMIFEDGTDDEGNEICISSIIPGGEEGEVFILGDRFMVNVQTTFNIKTNEITLTQRAPY